MLRILKVLLLGLLASATVLGQSGQSDTERRVPFTVLRWSAAPSRLSITCTLADRPKCYSEAQGLCQGPRARQ